MRGGMSALLAGAALVAGLLFGAATPASADDRGDAIALVDKSTITVRNFVRDPDMTWFQANAHKAKGLLIVPSMIKGGFILGGSGGSGVLVARGKAPEGWSDPAFYTVGSVTIGLQIGGEVSELVLIVMTQKGMDALLSNSFKLGGDVSVAAGPVGAGAKAQTADVIAFSRSKGAYGGINLEGAVIALRNDWNSAYYGRSVRPIEILVTREVSNPASANLQAELAGLKGL